jgi:hypothetical protein
VGSYPLSSQAPAHVEVELGCDNKIIMSVNLSVHLCAKCVNMIVNMSVQLCVNMCKNK